VKEERIRRLLEYSNSDPGDPFPVYGLAMEYLDTEPAKAREYFERLLNFFPEYLPTYYHSAAFFAETGNAEKAKALYLKGIELAKNQNQVKTFNELKAAYQNFLFEYED
jgi:tetratricopeptide (TPR) repeat protein